VVVGEGVGAVAVVMVLMRAMERRAKPAEGRMSTPRR
jgi:hypothetical protein